MPVSTPFTPSRIATVLFLAFVSIIIIFQNELTRAITSIGHVTCERVGPQHIHHQHLRKFPDVTPLEDLGPGGDDAWSQLTSRKGGFLWLQHNETFDTPWGISMFHGIHCLQMLRSEFQTELGINNGGEHHHHKRRIATKNDKHESEADLVHLGHCLAYIAEMLQCAGDGTIERPWMVRDKVTGDIIDIGLDGAGVQHQCRDTSHLWAAAEATEQTPARSWDHKPGDTVALVFGGV